MIDEDAIMAYAMTVNSTDITQSDNTISDS